MKYLNNCTFSQDTSYCQILFPFSYKFYLHNILPIESLVFAPYMKCNPVKCNGAIKYSTNRKFYDTFEHRNQTIPIRSNVNRKINQTIKMLYEF